MEVMSSLVRLAESKVVQLSVAAIVIVGLGVVAIAFRSNDDRIVVDAYERARAEAVAAMWTNEARADRCARRALREPTTGDGTHDLAALVDPTSSTAHCLLDAGRVHVDHEEWCAGHVRCPAAMLAGLAPQPAIVNACASLYAAIADHARATSACSPLRAGDALGAMDVPFRTMLHLPFAVRLQIAPLVANGELAAAAGHVLDAMRFADDYGRGTYLLGAMLSLAGTLDLADTLDELLVDPRLAPDDARAIARDLDILLATMPTVSEMFHHETAAMVTQLFRAQPITHAPEQDRALQILGQEKWLAEIDGACAGTSVLSCVEHLRALPAQAMARPDDFDRIIQSGDDHATRDQVVELIAASLASSTPEYARKLGDREIALRTLRMQAELRTIDIDACRDRRGRQTTLSPWLRDDLQLGDEPEPTVQLPRWRQTSDRAPYVLHCVAR
jgi:hypothetical protein